MADLDPLQKSKTLNQAGRTPAGPACGPIAPELADSITANGRSAQIAGHVP